MLLPECNRALWFIVSVILTGDGSGHAMATRGTWNVYDGNTTKG